MLVGKIQLLDRWPRLNLKYKKFMFKIKTLLFFILFQICAYSQFKKSDLKLSSEFVESILLDSRGVKWIGTDEGLNLITHSDNYPFYSNISNKKGILNSEIHKIKEINDRFIAVFSNSGISFFNPKTFSFSQLELKSKPIDIYFDNNTQKYWVTTVSSGIYILNSNKEIEKNLIYDPLNPLTLSSSSFDASNDNKLIDFEDDYYIYIATPNGFNLYNKSQGNVKRYFKQRSSSLLSNNINSIIRISETELLIATDKGINMFNTSSKKFSKTLIAEGKNVSHLFKINSDKYCFIAKGKLYFFDVNNRNLNLDPSLNIFLTNERLNVIKEEDQLYAYFKGDNKLISVDLNELSKQTISLNSNIQTTIFSDNQLYIGTSQGVYEQKNTLKLVENKTLSGIYYYHNSNNNLIVYKNKILVNNKKIKIPSGIDINNQTIFEFSKGLLFIGGENLTVLDVNKAVFFKNIFSRKDLLEGNLNNLKIINSNLYVSTGNGIVSYSIPESINNSFQDTLIKTQIKYKYNPLVNADVPKNFSDIELLKGYLWVGDKDEGLKVYKNNFNSFVKNFKYEENNKRTLASSNISKLYFKVNSEELYIASRGDGLFKLNLKDTTFNNITIDDGLLSNNIFDFMQKDNTMWIQTGNGINSINEKGEVRNINSEDGINIKNFHKEALHDLGEEILISGFDNFQIFDPSNMDLFQKEKFNLDILNVVGYDKENQSRYLEINGDNTVSIDNSISSIEINLFTDTKVKPEQIKYYLSSNIYKDVLFNGFNNKINLKSIPFYSSNFEIYAINGSGDKSNNVVSISIYNAPPLWLRIESIVGYVIVLILSITLFVRYKDKKTKEKMEGERKAKELEEAKELQNSLLPKVLPNVNGFEISTYLKPATEIGGDYYDFFYKKDNYFYAICGDATGHGVVSGIMVSVTKAGLNGIPMGDPSTILGQLNKIVKRVNFGRLRMSLSVAKFNKNSVELSSAAMPPTYHFSSKTKKMEEILVPNLPLGGIETEKFDGVKKEFDQGDVMVMISDGLPELPSPNDEMLDYEKVYSCIKDNAEKSADDIKDALVYLSDDWAKGVMNPDDITIVVIKKAA